MKPGAHRNGEVPERPKKQTWVRWVACGRGKICGWHRPDVKCLRKAKAEGCTNVITVQGAREYINDIRKAATEVELAWHWCNVPGANRPLLALKATRRALIEGLLEAWKLLEQGHMLFIHCAAGIHRTGIFTYTLFRLAWNSGEQERQRLLEMRDSTAANVGEERLSLVEEFVLPALLQKLQEQDGTPRGAQETPPHSPLSPDSETLAEIDVEDTFECTATDGV
eukprot:TRINITY_DN5066_c0_g1::TRINITY_DN5066_c0_g1_i1::g.24830::m.24830 TRINITY_DN5066_c0_g1::TRINITY_DN5066_c0_g1_i1::g.24830  ORF type:complete len:224 (-),score=-8.50,Y_phosphatase3/PF13350.1/0.0075,Y_phosphatase/PF00102.22/0.011,DSPc/PF00782.15/5.1e+03,DSPc/PF00782.15/0.11 TRINITY_DN5066_c0_g1_i1:442-1113(-)